MTTTDIYNLAIKLGIKNDLRGEILEKKGVKIVPCSGLIRVRRSM